MGLSDQPAAQAALMAAAPGLPVWVIGHSLGGLMLPFHPAARAIERVITVASGPIHVTDHPWPYRAVAHAFWHGPGPLAAVLAGYLPGRALGLGENLPAGVYWQWRRWSNARGFWRSEIGDALPMPDWHAVRARMSVVAVEDDDMVQARTVWRLMGLYPAARKRQLVLRPADFGLKKIGHLGAFARRSAAVWPALLEERHHEPASHVRAV